jgi:hypothetical protein
MSVTRFGVSLLKVVATIERPASHHGTDRPEAKNSDVLRPARFAKNNAGTKHTSSEATMISQSIGARVMARHCTSADSSQLSALSYQLSAFSFCGVRTARVAADVYLSLSDSIPMLIA